MKIKKSNIDGYKIQKRIEEILSLQTTTEEISKLHKQISKLPSRTQNELLLLCNKSIVEESYRSEENLRISISKILVSLFPESFQTIKNILSVKSGRYIYELHFSIFCFLDKIVETARTKKNLVAVAKMVGNYLINIHTETSHAAWMAGDLLGDHWDLNISLPILIKVAKVGRHIAGRCAAIHGFEQLFYKKIGKSMQDEVISILKELSKTDRSKKVRIRALLVLNSLKK